MLPKSYQISVPGRSSPCCSPIDPYSPLVPGDVRECWRSSEEVYKLSRNYFYDIHNKREKAIEAKSASQTQHENEDEDISPLIITFYEKI